MLEGSAEPITSLYVHVPFCARKCSYCAFFSEPSSGETIDRYVASLIRELELVAADLKVETVFFGGGTPSLLNLRQWEQVLRAFDRLGLLGAAEWTVESNPATVSLDKARLLRSYGVNRMSMGVQSLNSDLLDRLGRVHTRDMVFKSFDLLRRAGFENLNLDLMFAIPGQTLEIWRETLIEATAMGSEHLSTYEVIYEEDTALFADLQARRVAEDEDLACAMYEEFIERAARAGFQQYEVANFARDREGGMDWERAGKREAEKPFEVKSGGATAVAARTSTARSALRVPAYACRHNVNYWRGGSFYGLGPSATSYIRGVRTRNWSNTDLYCCQLEGGKRAIESTEELPPLARAGETAAFGLRMVAGWAFDQFREVTGYDLRNDWADDMARLVEQDWGVQTEDGFRLTPRGLRFADAAAELFLR